MHGTFQGSPSKRIAGSIVTATCACGQSFTYRRGVQARRVCDVCENENQRAAMEAYNTQRSQRNAELPKVWGHRLRRAYVTAERATHKMIPLINRLPPEQAAELIGHLLAQTLNRPEA